MEPSVLFCTPMYGGKNEEAHFKSCLNLKEELTRVGLKHDWLTGRNESLVHRARMEMTGKFLRNSAHTHMMWLDADIEFEPEHVAKLWNICMGENGAAVDIAVGVYAMKKRDQQWYAAWKDGQLVKDLDQFDGPTEVDYAGTGFMLMSRKAVLGIHDYLNAREARVLKLLKQITPVDAYDEHLIKEMANAFRPDYLGNEGRVPALYMTPIYDDGLESEDYHFSRIAREAGFKVIMDPSVRLKHWGSYAYGASA